MHKTWALLVSAASEAGATGLRGKYALLSISVMTSSAMLAGDTGALGALALGAAGVTARTSKLINLFPFLILQRVFRRLYNWLINQLFLSQDSSISASYKPEPQS